MLKDRINRIIIKYKLNTVFEEKRQYVDASVVKNNVIKEFLGKNIVIFPFGKLGKDVADAILDSDGFIECLIDNYKQESEYRNISIICLMNKMYLMMNAMSMKKGNKIIAEKVYDLIELLCMENSDEKDI